MQPPVLGRNPLHLSLWLCFFASTATADIGGWTEGLEGRTVPLAEAVLIAGCALAALSLLLLLIALLELTGKCFPLRWCGEFTYPIAHVVLATLWLPIIGISVFLLTQHHYPAIAFVAAGGAFVVAHATIVLCQNCWCCCGGVFVGSPTENQKSALLKSQGGDQRPSAGDDGGRIHLGPAPLGPGGNAEGRNPFCSTYGLLPGSSSVFAYQIFIPGADTEQAGSCNYTGLQSGPRAEGRPARPKTQSIVPLQPTAQQQRQLGPGAHEVRL